jgi:hypothetical protein
VWLGLFPQPVLDRAKPAILKTLNKQKEISYNYPGRSDKILCYPSCKPLCTFVVEKNYLTTKEHGVKTQSNSKEKQNYKSL